MAKIQLDKRDMGILRMLDDDARRPYSEMAKALKMSKDAVQYRVERMRAEGIIKGFYAVIDPSALGYLSCRFFMKLRNSTPIGERKLLDYLVKDLQYWWVDSIDGIRDIGAACWLKDTNEFARKKDELRAKFGENLASLEEAVYSAFYLYPRSYLRPSQAEIRKPLILCRGKLAELDELDWKLLTVIADDARISSIAAAKRTGVTPATILNRLKRLEQNGVIRQYRAMIDLSKLGYYWYKVEFMLSDQAAKKKMLDFFAGHPNIVYAYETIGGPDLEVEMEVKSYEHFREILDEIRAKFGEQIETFQHMLWYKEHKITYLPHTKS